MSLQQIPQVAKHVSIITKNDMKIDGDSFHTIESYGPAGDWYISFRDNPFNVDKYDVYGLKKFIRYVFGIPTSKMSRDELAKIYLDRVEGSYSLKKQTEKKLVSLPPVSIPFESNEYIPLPLPTISVAKKTYKRKSTSKKRKSSKGKRKSGSKKRKSSKGKRKSGSKKRKSSKGKSKSGSKGKRR